MTHISLLSDVTAPTRLPVQPCKAITVYCIGAAVGWRAAGEGTLLVEGETRGGVWQGSVGREVAEKKAQGCYVSHLSSLLYSLATLAAWLHQLV